MLNGELTSRSIIILSDYPSHDVNAVFFFQNIVINELKDIKPNIEKIVYFTNRCAAQFKNRKNFLNLLNHKVDFNIKAEWNFFATSHGKSPCDGLGTE